MRQRKPRYLCVSGVLKLVEAVGIEPTSPCHNNPEKTGLPPTPSDASAHISAQILGSEGQYETQPDVTGGGIKKQKPLKTGAQVAHWPIEAQKKLVEAVGIESKQANTQNRQPRRFLGVYSPAPLASTQ